MTTVAQTFVSCAPWTEEEMRAIGDEIVRRSDSRAKSAQSLDDAAEIFEQLAEILRERATRARGVRANPLVAHRYGTCQACYGLRGAVQLCKKCGGTGRVPLPTTGAEG